MCVVCRRQWRCENVRLATTASERRAGRSQTESKLLPRLRRQWRRLISQGSCARTASVLLDRWWSTRASCIAARESAQFVLLADIPLQHSVHLVDIDRNLCSDILRVVSLVRHNISRALHAVHVLRAPGVHAQALDLADMCAQLPVQRSAAHTQEDTQVPARPSWVLCATVCAAIVAGDIVNEILESLFVASLLPFRYGRSHYCRGLVRLRASLRKRLDTCEDARCRRKEVDCATVTLLVVVVGLDGKRMRQKERQGGRRRRTMGVASVLLRITTWHGR